MCATRTNTLILGQSLILALKTYFSKQNNHISEDVAKTMEIKKMKADFDTQVENLQN